MKLGVFDSGIGGEAVAQSLKQAFPQAHVLTVNDKAHLPYGNRAVDDIVRLTDAAIQPLLEERCDVIVLACNTATAAAIETLRNRYPDQQFIGLEPMIKPASKLSRTQTVAICATPATLGSDRYRSLKNRFATNTTVLEPDCSDWASLIEQDQLATDRIQGTIDQVIAGGADVIVLACTHYHWIKDTIEQAATSKAMVIDPSDAIVKRVTDLMA